MPVDGLQRYFRLFKHIQNPFEYLTDKISKKGRSLFFITKPYAIRFEVPSSLYLLFKEIFMHDVYEIDELAATLPSEPTIIDIGANAGFFCIQLLSKIGKAKIFAYEPMPANVAIFQRTIELNENLKQSVQLYKKAVTGLPLEHLELYAESEDKTQVVASIFSGFNSNNTNKITVPCITLNEIIADTGCQNIDLLKLDCEGSEYDIMYHSDPDLLKRFNRMEIEVHNMDDEKNNFKYFNEFIQSLGYTTTSFPINDFCFAMKAIRN